MFNTIVNPSSGVPRQRWATTMLSAIAHVAVMVVIVLSTLYATDTLPQPPETMAFFVAAPAPPPPPPPPAPAVVEPARKATTPVRRAPARSAPVSAKAPGAAPVEAPDTIAPETGLEGGEFVPAGIEAGFEGGLAGGISGGIIGGIEVAPPPPPAAPVRVGGEISAPRLIHRVGPEYPSVAVAAKIEGIVILEATVDTTGVVTDARVLRSHSVLEEAAIDAVRQWRYEPLLLNGKPTPFVLTVTVSFSLTD
jgi:periplasmic protein TonB